MGTTFIFNPTVTLGVIAAIFSISVLAAIVKDRGAIGKGLEQLRIRLFTRAGFFWTVNIVFMAVSVLHAGIFFGITGNGHDLPGASAWLGFAVSFFLDLVTIILMQAMLESRYRSEENRARQFLFFIVLCCGTSTFANLAISLNDFNAAVMLPRAPLWIAIASPYVLASFPLFVIMMSVASEMIVNVRPLESLNEDEYEADEQKRVNIMAIRNTYLQRQCEEELRMLTIRNQMKANKRRSKPSGSPRFFWQKTSGVDAIIASATEDLRAHYHEQIGALNEYINKLQNAPVTMDEVSPRVLSAVAPMSTKEDKNEHDDEQENAPIDLNSRRQNEQRDTEPLAPRSGTRGDSEALKKVRRLIRRNEHITAQELAQKVGISRSYAGKLKALILEEANDKAPA